MERERTCEPPILPAALAERIAGRAWSRDTVGEAGCAVWRLHRPGAADYYLKQGDGARTADILDEATRLRWLAGRLPVPAVRHLTVDGDAAWLLTDAIAGPTAWQALDARPGRRGEVVDALADFLRRIHALPVDRCPFEAGHALRLAHARDRLEAGEIDESDFGEDHAGWSAARLWEEITTLLPFDAGRVVTHGDYSLDNIVMAEGGVAGCLDVGRLGVADPHQDVAILWECLGEFDAELRERFLARIGIAAVNERRLRFHLMLDECF
ncbi:APH(3') family aminoglycoside O-phosphotransferase [Sphingomonas sp.]|uniref:APH(3') family aminoglycoside O-phosphotransferase n=1 Tax=Sphingomonas sp. TaxID=28214 RepID=UPI003B006D2A